MKRNLLILLCIVMSSNLWSQSSEIYFQESLSQQGDCYDVVLDYKDEGAFLASQNLRFYYDARVMKFDQSKSKLHIQGEYQYNIVQTNHDVDASGIGSLPFEKHLGFINMTVILPSPRSEATRLEMNQSLPIVQLCFDMKEASRPSIVFARQERTSDYGRAFVELSQIYSDGSVKTLNIGKYQDLN